MLYHFLLVCYVQIVRCHLATMGTRLRLPNSYFSSSNFQLLLQPPPPTTPFPIFSSLYCRTKELIQMSTLDWNMMIASGTPVLSCTNHMIYVVEGVCFKAKSGYHFPLHATALAISCYMSRFHDFTLFGLLLSCTNEKKSLVFTKINNSCI